MDPTSPQLCTALNQGRAKPRGAVGDAAAKNRDLTTTTPSRLHHGPSERFWVDFRGDGGRYQAVPHDALPKRPAAPRVLFVTFGSQGDLLPCLAMARAVLRAGGRATVATHANYERAVLDVGAAFAALPPSPEEMPIDAAWAKGANAPVRGLEFIIKSMVLPHFAQVERRLFAIAPGHDVIVSHFLALALPGVAEALGIPWLSTAYSPVTLFSAHDPPALGILPFLPRLRFLGPRRLDAFYRFLAHPSRDWFGVLHDQRLRLKLAPLATNPVFRYFSPHGTLALFSESFAAPQPDWPARTSALGFPPVPVTDKAPLSPATLEFIRAGAPPLVFSLGSLVSLMKSPFFEIARAAVERKKRRAIFVTNEPHARAVLASVDPRLIHVTPHEPFATLFPLASVVIHQGGIHTTGLAVATRRPQVVVPFGNDQFDNAFRVVRGGWGAKISARRLSVRRLGRALDGAARLQVTPPSPPTSAFDQRLLAAIDQTLGAAPPGPEPRSPRQL